jgi:hypothetical protein
LYTSRRKPLSGRKQDAKAVAQAPKQADRSIDAPDLAEWLAFAVAEHVAREG